MPRLKAANDARTVLTQAVGVSDTTIYVEDVSKFPAPPFRITVDNEIMEVTAVDSGAKAFTVMRAQENTVAASHLAGAAVENRWTAGTYDELVSQSELSDAMQNVVNKNGDTINGVITMSGGNGIIFGGKFRIAYNSLTDSLDITVVG